MFNPVSKTGGISNYIPHITIGAAVTLAVAGIALTVFGALFLNLSGGIFAHIGLAGGWGMTGSGIGALALSALIGSVVLSIGCLRHHKKNQELNAIYTLNLSDNNQ